MGLIADDHKDLSDQEMMDQCCMALAMIDSESTLTGNYIGGCHGPFGDIKLPLRQTIQITHDVLFAKGLRSDYR